MSDPNLSDEFVYSNKNPTIFLDIDGVLNDHSRLNNGFSTINQENVSKLNYIFSRIPNLQLVISSAWRYIILNNHMSLIGFEIMLLTYGINCHNRVVGHTRKDLSDGDYSSDGESYQRGLQERVNQINDFIEYHKLTNYIILDDLTLPFISNRDRFIQTNPATGMTLEDADNAIKLLCSVK